MHRSFLPAMSNRFDIMRIARNFVTVNVLITFFRTFVRITNEEVIILRVLTKISQELKKQGKKQKDLTDYLGISKNVYTDWKSGKCQSYKKHLPAIASFLNVPIDYLLDNQSCMDDELALRFALFGGDAEYISEDAFEEVKRFAKYVAEKEKEKKGEQ